LVGLANCLRLDLLLLAYRNMGILNFHDLVDSGEDYFIRNLLKKNIRTPEPVLLDVGANVGNYSELLREVFPSGRIYAFEPMPKNFKELTQRLQSQQINCIPMGLSSQEGSEVIYDYPDKSASSHASRFREAFTDYHRCSNPESFKCVFTTLDKFCAQQGISKIDLLKVDTEGTELDVLKGGAGMLAQNKISVIQFEFGENDIFSRVFLKDFFELLPKFRFYRVHRRGLTSLRQYDVQDEIFRFQNIVAIHQDSEFKY
jgi:FkbM family methyltransferase